MTNPPALWRDRIVRTSDEDPRSLLANPANWRLHPSYQKDAVEALLERIGWIDTVIVNETTGHMLDGHLRVEIAADRGEPTVPVTWVRLAPAEEPAALAAIDLIRGAAGIDRAKAAALYDQLGGLTERHQGALDLLRARVLPGHTGPNRGPLSVGPERIDHVADALDAEDALSGGELVRYGDDERGKTVEEKHTDYLASDTRQLVLLYDSAVYSEVAGLLDAARRHYAVETNAAAVAALLVDPEV